MIIGTGVDIVRISRFKKYINNRRFLNRFFDDMEIELIEARGASSPQSLAGRFAAREAFFKALGTGFKGFSMKDISVINDSNGKPIIIPSEKVECFLNEIGNNWVIHLSISHEKEYAIAQVIVEDPGAGTEK